MNSDNSDSPTYTSSIKNKTLLWSIFFTLFCLGSFICGAIKIYLEKPQEGFALFAAGLVFFILKNPEGLESLKVWGIEAKIKILDEKADALRKLTERVTEAAKINADFSFRMLTKIEDDEPGSSRAEKLEAAKILTEHLVALGLNSEDIERLKAPWNQSIYIDLARPLTRAIEGVKARISLDLQKSHGEVETVQFPKMVWLNLYKELPEKSFLAIEANIKLVEPYLNDAEKTVINDYWKHVDYFLKNKTLRDVEYWKTSV